MTNYTTELFDGQGYQVRGTVDARSKREAADKYINRKQLTRQEAENMTVSVWETPLDDGDREDFNAAEFVD